MLGDYNEDDQADYNNVSAADYTLWQSSYSSEVYNPNADGNDDGVVDADDYLVWDDHFGNTLTLQNVNV